MEAPQRLRPRTHVIPLGDGLLLRRGADALKLVEPADAALLRSVLGLLGEPVDDLAPPADEDDSPAPSLVAVLRMIDELAGQGFVVTDEAETWSPPPVTPTSAGQWLFTGTVGVVGDVAARHAVDRLDAIGAQVVCWHRSHEEARSIEHLPPADLIVACLDGPDLALLDAIDEWSGPAGVPWFPAFVLGDEAVLGPLRRPGQGGCMRCWELRWLGIIPSVVAEKAYLRHVRAGHWRHELPVDEGVAHWVGHQAAVEAIAALHRPAAARPEVVIGDLRAASAGWHPLVRHPACDRCAPRYREPSRAQAEATWSGWNAGRIDPDRGPVDFGGLVDARLGLVSPVDIESEPRDVLGIAVARFAIPHPDRLARDPDSASYGAGRDVDEAELVAKVEGLERYCGLFLPPPSVEAAYADVRDDAIDPRSLPLYSERQYATPGFPRPRFDEGLVLPWVWAASLTTGRARLVPQPSVRFGGTEDDLLDETSSGVAAHATRARALLSAVSELVERDAFMISWLHALVPPRIDPTSVRSPFAVNALAAVARGGYEAVLLDITSDLGVPVVLALGLCTDGSQPALRLGAGCHVDAAVAVDKSLRELLGAVQSVPTAGWTPGEPMAPEDVRSLRDHSVAYAHPAWLRRAEFLWSSPDRRAVTEVGAVAIGSTATEQLVTVVGQLEEHGHEVLAADLTPPDVAGTIEVVRAIVPGLQPIGFGPFGLRLGGRRLYEAPVRMGRRRSVATEDDLNRDPHCFP